MTRPYVRVRVLSDDSVVGLQPGDLIGRSRAAALRLNSPRISEAHAFISLREGHLKLLALRGRIAQAGEPPVTELALQAGMTIKLARDMKLLVEAVSLPPSLLGLVLGGVETPLLAPEYSLYTTPLSLSARYRADADGHIWSVDERWFLKLSDQERQPLEAGQHIAVGDTSVSVVQLSLADLAATRTVGTAYAKPAEPGLRVELQRESCLIRKPDGTSVGISGVMATLLHVAALAHPNHLHWSAVTSDVWFDGRPLPGDQDLASRSKFHRARQRLRAKLQESSVREDLFGPAGHGQWRLTLSPGDQLVLLDT